MTHRQGLRVSGVLQGGTRQGDKNSTRLCWGHLLQHKVLGKNSIKVKLRKVPSPPSRERPLLSEELQREVVFHRIQVHSYPGWWYRRMYMKKGGWKQPRSIVIIIWFIYYMLGLLYIYCIYNIDNMLGCFSDHSDTIRSMLSLFGLLP